MKTAVVKKSKMLALLDVIYILRQIASTGHDGGYREKIYHSGPSHGYKSNSCKGK